MAGGDGGRCRRIARIRLSNSSRPDRRASENYTTGRNIEAGCSWERKIIHLRHYQSNS